MSEQDGKQATTKPRRSRQTSKQNGTQKTTLQLPANNDKEAWEVYWKAQGQPWRWEPEIDAERQKYLDERRSIRPDIKQGIYPFGGIKLSRADVEWLLATHENGRGPVDWSDESQREREGLDLRGADLRHEHLVILPLTKLCGGLTVDDWFDVAEEQHAMAAVQMEGTNLIGAELQGASLLWTELQGADLSWAQLEEANLSWAKLKGANLSEAQLEGANLSEAQLEGANLSEAQLKGANLRGAQLKGANLEDVFLAAEARHIGPQLADVQWGDTNLTVVDWEQITKLGDERLAAQKIRRDGKKKGKSERLADYKTAVRAYRQLSVMLRNQGLNEDAARFTYRSQIMQRKVFWYQGIRKFGQYLFSLFLDLLAGYGYKPGRSFLAYAFVIGTFAALYFYLGTHLAWNEAIVISMTAFHGRGFFPDQFHPGDPQALVAAIEAFVGLLIEVTFIATLTQRLFGK